MPRPKSQKTLHRRLALLRERGITGLAWDRATTLRDIIDVVGDLSLTEYQELVEMDSVAGRDAAAGGATMPSPGRSD